MLQQQMLEPVPGSEITLTEAEGKEMQVMMERRDSIESVVQIAIDHGSNQMQAVRRDEQAWWKRMAEKYGIEVPGKQYAVQTDLSTGASSIVALQAPQLNGGQDAGSAQAGRVPLDT